MSPRRIVCDGNSLTQGFGAAAGLSYPEQMQALYGSAFEVINAGAGGQRTEQAILQLGSRIQKWSEPRAQLVFFETYNQFLQDLAGGVSAADGLAAEQARAQTYVAQAKALGFEVWICSPPPTITTNIDTRLQPYATWLRENHGFADGFIDLNAAPEFYPTGSLLNPTMYADQVHLTAAGYAVVAARVKAALR